MMQKPVKINALAIVETGDPEISLSYTQIQDKG